MKKIITLSLMLFFGLHLNGQNEVRFNINHFIGASPFEMDLVKQTAAGHNFTIERLDYYISEITLKHDGGQELLIENLWILVDPTSQTSVSLGTDLMVNSIESISFGLGVDSAHNHLDPTLWDSDHPLAPQFPNMHWGWVTGYRFLAIEGLNGVDVGNVYQIHGLGDAYYHRIELAPTPTIENNVISLDIYADYTQVFNNIDMSRGLISHDPDGAGEIALLNFRDYVFSTQTPTTTPLLNDDAINISVFPNPTNTGAFNLNITDTDHSIVTVTVINTLGAIILEKEINTNMLNTFEIDTKGLYLLKIEVEGVGIKTTKIIVN